MNELRIKVNCFNLKYTLECGQCFRWKYCEKNDSYIGVVFDRVIEISQKKDLLIIKSNLIDNLEKAVIDYFDLNKDYQSIEYKISQIDENIAKSVSYTSGIRILNQPLFETIISYIISANNNIKRISRSVDLISQKYGKKIIYENKEYYLFPTIEELSNATTEDLLSCGVGFRARYIKNTVKEIRENKINILSDLENMDTVDVKKYLLSLQGIGPKVADCILLFSLKRSETFPIDVWVKRIMEKLYFKENVSMKRIGEYAKENFGSDAGIVQQHLFYNVREGNI